MVNARPGYWDMDRCAWVGVEPMYVVPPLLSHRHGDPALDDLSGAVPAPREVAEDDPAATQPR